MTQIDTLIFQKIFSFAGQSAILDLTGLFFAVVFPYILAIGFLFAVFQRTKDWRRRFYYLSFTLVALIVSLTLISNAFHTFYPRERPHVALGLEPLFLASSQYAFPSNHATILFTLAFALWFFSKAKNVWLRAKESGDEFLSARFHWWFFSGVVLVVMARVFSGVHYPLDVAAGALISLFAVIIANWILPVTR